ncbi:MAG: hypothetical protein QXQ29_04480 [Candidatus Bathyarchaeia archaeon]
MSREELINLLRDRMNVVVDCEDKGYAYRKVYDTLGVDNLQLHLYTCREYEKLSDSRPSFIREVEGKDIIIFEV